MAENSHGVYVSVRSVDGVLVSTYRDTWAEVTNDLNQIFGENWPELLPAVNAEVEVGAGAPPAESIVTTPAMAQQLVNEAGLGATTQAAHSFERCMKCGVGIKDKWVAPGVSKRTGKPYPGFYGCNNPSCR